MGDLTWQNRETGESVTVSRKDLLKSKVHFCFDPLELSFLERMREYSEGPIPWFTGNPETWKIGVFHINRNKSKNQLGDIRLMDPKEFDGKHSVKYTKFWEGDSESEAREILPKIQSYWNSQLLQYLLSKCWHTYTLQKTMYSELPAPDYSKIWTDGELFDRYELTEEEKRWIL